MIQATDAMVAIEGHVIRDSNILLNVLMSSRYQDAVKLNKSALHYEVREAYNASLLLHEMRLAIHAVVFRL